MFSTPVPDRFVSLAADWAGGEDCMLRAVSSTGTVALGTIRPYDRDAGRYLTDPEWFVSLFAALASDIRSCLRLARRNPLGSAIADLEAFEAWTEGAEASARAKHGLVDSDVV